MPARLCPRDDSDTTRAPLAARKRRPEARRQLEVADVVGRQLRLEPARVAHQRRRHDPGVVHQHVQRAARGHEARGKRVDRRGIEEIETLDLDAREPGQRRARRVEGPRADDHRRAGLGQRARGLEADARMTAGDEGEGAVKSRSPRASRAVVCSP